MKVEIFDVDHGACALITTSINQHVLLDCGHRAGPTAKVENTLSQMMVDAALGMAPSSVSGIVAALGLASAPVGALPLSALPAVDILSELLTSVTSPDPTGWRPSEELARRGIRTIDKLIVSNADEDHLSDLHNIYGKTYIAELMTNPTISPQWLRMMKLWSPGPGASALIKLMGETATFQPCQILADIQHFWVINGSNGISDTNNLSVVTFISWGDLHMIFPGDIEGPAWELLLMNNEFLQYLRRVNVFVASHHGRRSGYHADVFRNGRCCPVLVVISDKAVKHGTQEGMSTIYGNIASGAWINGEFRRVLTTRNDGRITFSFNELGRARVELG